MSTVLRNILASPGEVTRAGLSQRTGMTRATISRHTSACAPPASVPDPASAIEPSVPPVAIRTMRSSWWRMNAEKGSCPREPPMKSVSAAPFGQTLTRPSSTLSAASRYPARSSSVAFGAIVTAGLGRAMRSRKRPQSRSPTASRMWTARAG